MTAPAAARLATAVVARSASRRKYPYSAVTPNSIWLVAHGIRSAR